MQTLRVGYWKTHPYRRLSVEIVEEFCGWKTLQEIVDHAGSERNRAFIVTMFKTGGRVSEVLLLRKRNFELLPAQRVIVVRDMRVLKRYRKIGEYIDEEGRKRWQTVILEEHRKPFPILVDEPLTDIMLAWIQKLPGEESLLFESPVKPGMPLTRIWAYRMLRKLYAKLPTNLKSRLGFIRKGREIGHLFNHWFRAQRASQLVFEYDYGVLDLLKYFSWQKHDTAVHYAQKGWIGLAEKMLQRTSIRHSL